MTLTPTEEETVINPVFLRSEVNLLIYPFFALSRQNRSSRKIVEYRSEIAREEDRIEVLWKVSANTEFGFPGPFDKRVYRAIEEVICEQELPVENPITFSIYELCQKTEISTGGSNYRKIKEALQRIQATTITSKGTFYHKGKKKWIERSFSLYSDLIFKGETKADGTICESNLLFLGNLYLQSINARYVKPLDYRYYKSLQSNISKRLYELLGIKLYGILCNKPKYLRYRYSTLCQLLPLRRQKYFSKAKQILNFAHKELTETKFLSDFRWEEVEDERDWLIYYRAGERMKKEAKEYESKGSSIVGLGQRLLGTDEEKTYVSSLVGTMMEVTGDYDSEKFYRRVAKLAVKKPRLEELIFQTTSEVKDASLTKKVNNKGALFTHILKKKCTKAGIDLGLKT